MKHGEMLTHRPQSPQSPPSGTSDHGEPPHGEPPHGEKQRHGKTPSHGEPPQHIAVIMDGNGRWARERGMRRIAGHIAGMKSVAAIVKAARELGIGHLSLYAFSIQNWGRPEGEVAGLMDLLGEYLERETANLVENGVRLNPIGRLDRLPPRTRAALEETVKKTRRGKNSTLTLALSYGAREEIVDAVKKIAAEKIRPEKITEKTVERRLHTAGLPEPDLLIRTGGEMRLSNFFLWQSAYTEIYVTKTLWPDFRKRHLIKAVETFKRRERRFGLTKPRSEKRSNPRAGNGEKSEPRSKRRTKSRSKTLTQTRANRSGGGR